MSEFDWSFVERVITKAIGKGSLIIEPDKHSAMIVKRELALAVVQPSVYDKDTLFVSLRASLPPNTAGSIVSSLNQFYKVVLDPYFEYADNGEVLTGLEATRYFAENALLFLFNERLPSRDSIKVRPKGAYLKHIN